jgi:hypothetical protein
MSRLLHTLRVARPALPVRIAVVARSPTMIRGYPARSEMDDADPEVFL